MVHHNTIFFFGVVVDLLVAKLVCIIFVKHTTFVLKQYNSVVIAALFQELVSRICMPMIRWWLVNVLNPTDQLPELLPRCLGEQNNKGGIPGDGSCENCVMEMRRETVGCRDAVCERAGDDVACGVNVPSLYGMFVVVVFFVKCENAHNIPSPRVRC
jgi:hypothetical protein